MEIVRSPLTGSPADLIESIDSNIIIDLYEKAGLNVSEYFTETASVSIYKCPDTNFRFYHPGGLAAKGAFYEQLQSKFGNYYPVKWEHNRSLRYIHPGNKVLDIGCGDASFLLEVRNKIQDAAVEGIEFNELAIKKAAANGIKVTADSIETLAGSSSEKFDFVTAYQVLEHIVDVRSFLQAAVTCIKPGGKLIIGVPNNHPYLYKTDKLHTLNLPPHHMGLWSRESLHAIARLFNLTIVECTEEPLQNTYYYTDFYLQKHGLVKYRKLLFPLLQRWFKYTKSFRKGQAILAVFEKKRA